MLLVTDEIRRTEGDEIRRTEGDEVSKTEGKTLMDLELLIVS